jgi:hypothetical protein
MLRRLQIVNYSLNISPTFSLIISVCVLGVNVVEFHDFRRELKTCFALQCERLGNH